MAKARNKKKRAKKFQFQMGWGGMLAFTTATLCILLWVFVLGFWAGKRFTGGTAQTSDAKNVLALKDKSRSTVQAPVQEENSWPGPWDTGAPSEEQPVAEGKTGTDNELMPAPSVKAEQQVEAKVEKLREKLELTPEAGQIKEKAEEQPPKPVEKKVEKKPVTPKVQEKAIEKAKPQAPFFALQIASYKQKSRAQKEAGRWRRKGYKTTIKKVNLGARKGTWYRVYIGRFDTAAKAKSFAERLAKNENLRAYVVPVRP